MFSFFRKERVPTGPHEFGAETEVARKADELFSLLDLNSPLYWKRQMGDRIEKIAPDTFEMVIKQLPDVRFTLSITEYEPGRVIAFEAVSEPRMGRLDRAIERYEITEFEPGMSRLELGMTVFFQNELKLRAFQDEQVLLGISTFNAVEKIRLFAEEGEQAVQVADEQLIVGIDKVICPDS
ncbi:MAG: hypothetical protein KDE32_15665 [Novosphingobium sp.]|nr:hypothetical protein [Novosphingobium sp.]